MTLPRPLTAALLVLAAGAAWSQTLRWSNLNSTSPPSARRSSSGALYSGAGGAGGNAFLIYGGFNGGGLQSDALVLSTGVNAWATVVGSGTPPGTRERHALAYSPLDDKVVLVSGGSAPIPYTFSDTVHIFDPRSSTWTLAVNPTTRPAARVDGKLEWVPELNAFLYFGGHSNVSGDLPRYNDLWALRLNDAGIDWTPLAPLGTPPTARGAVCGAYVPDRKQLVLFGGETANAGQSNELWAYDVPSNTWLQLPNGNAPPARAFCGTAWDRHARVLFLHGGQAGSNPVGGSYSYDFDAGAWTSHGATGGPTTLSDSAAAYSPALGGVVFFGGRVNPVPSTYSNTTWLARLNHVPLADAGPNLLIDEGSFNTITQASASDPDGDPLTYAWVSAGSPGLTLSNATTLSPSFTAPTVTADTTVTLILNAQDGLDVFSSALAVLIRDAVNEVPIADAGPDLTAVSGDLVTLYGGAVDPNGDALTQWVWSQQAGPVVPTSLTQNTVFTAPTVSSNTVLQFSLTVTDARAGVSAPDTVFVTVTPFDGGIPDGGTDAGAPDGGGGDAGTPDAGSPDAGDADAGTADAGDHDAGSADAGLLADGGASDAGVEQADAGDDFTPRSYGVGCGCGAAGATGWLWLVALALLKRARRAAVGVRRTAARAREG